MRGAKFQWSFFSFKIWNLAFLSDGMQRSTETNQKLFRKMYCLFLIVVAFIILQFQEIWFNIVISSEQTLATVVHDIYDMYLCLYFYKHLYHYLYFCVPNPALIVIHRAIFSFIFVLWYAAIVFRNILTHWKIEVG